MHASRMEALYSKRKLPAKILSKLLAFYENEYLYFDKIADYKKTIITSQKRVDLAALNQWLKNNYPGDKYTKITTFDKKTAKRMNDSFLSDIIIEDVQYIRIKFFTEEIANKTTELIRTTTAGCLVFDLRDSAGGSIEAAAKIADLLVPQGEICTLHGKNGIQKIMSSNKAREFKKIFLMVNKNTMSSAEVLLMALALDLSNVFIIGNETYMKNIGQKSLLLKKKRLMFSFSAFEWKVHDMTIADFYDMLRKTNSMIRLRANADYNEYISKIVYLITGDIY